jgi:DNA polymerase
MRGLGKTGELASQYGGWINAWLRFGAGKYIKERDDLKNAILKWRAASPGMEEIWGGQLRKHEKYWMWKPELWGIEGAVVKALQNPGKFFDCKTLSFVHDTRNDVLLCRLPSGRCLWYRQPRLVETTHKWSGLPVWRIMYKTWSDKDGWHFKDTYGARIFENTVQADCRDIMAMSMLRLERHGYPIVIHVHDEPVMEVPRGYGSLNEVKELMGITEGWYSDYPIVAGGAWRGEFFRK